MPFIVTENCIKCKYTDCVEVCPVDCFHEGPNMLVIDPDECIDCSACVAECPVEAIYAEDEIPDSEEASLEFNVVEAARIKDAGEEPIVDQKEPLPSAEERRAALGF